MKAFNKSFTQQNPIPEMAIKRAVEVLNSGRLHRYNTLENELSAVDEMEIAFAKYMDMEYCLACASGGYAMYIALKSAGVEKDDVVLTNAFTLAPVPGVIYNTGARPIFINTDENLYVDFDHLELCIAQYKPRFFLISHMRGHISDMDRITLICQQHNIILIEDCAHTMGAEWSGLKSGSFGDIACFSTQTYKHINSGEGGLVVTNNSSFMSQMIVLSGSYRFYGKHKPAPSASDTDESFFNVPNFSGRMDNLRASILLPQLQMLDDNVKHWYERYCVIQNELKKSDNIRLTKRVSEELFVGSSIQFFVENYDYDQIANVVEIAADLGVSLKWFGKQQAEGYTSNVKDWKYLNNSQDLSSTLDILSRLIDMRIPLTFDLNDCQHIAEVINFAVQEVNQH